MEPEHFEALYPDTTRFKEIEKIFSKYPDPTLLRGIGNKKNVVNLFEVDDISENIDGVTIWDGSDPFEINDEKILEEDE